MNDPRVLQALGAVQGRHFETCNTAVHVGFLLQGDGMRNSKVLLPDLINNGIRLLVYAGNVGRYLLDSTQKQHPIKPLFTRYGQ